MSNTINVSSEHSSGNCNVEPATRAAFESIMAVSDNAKMAESLLVGRDSDELIAMGISAVGWEL